MTQVLNMKFTPDGKVQVEGRDVGRVITFEQLQSPLTGLRELHITYTLEGRQAGIDLKQKLEPDADDSEMDYQEGIDMGEGGDGDQW